MSNYNLDVGINLNERVLNLSIPNETEITDLKYIAKTDNSNNYIAETNNKGYFHYIENGEEVSEIFYEKNNVNLNRIVLPENFGTIVEIDSTAILYEYITRASNEKVFVFGEDFSKSESMNKDDILTEIEENVRAYGVPVDSIVGFDGDEIPDGYVEVSMTDVECVCLNADYTLQSDDTYEKLPLTQELLKLGNGLSVNSNGEIIIGEGVDYIKISGQAYFFTGTLNSMKYLNIRKNGNDQMITNFYITANYQHITSSEKIIPVEEGDVITMEVKGKAGDLIKSFRSGTFLTVESVDGDIDNTVEDISNTLDVINGEVIE